MKPFIEILVAIIFIAMLVATLPGHIYAWSEWRNQLNAAQSKKWVRISISVSLFAVTLQAVLFLAFWTPIVSHPSLLMGCVLAALFSALLAIPCIFAWTGRARWLLLTACATLLVLTFLVVLGQVAY